MQASQDREGGAGKIVLNEGVAHPPRAIAFRLECFEKETTLVAEKLRLDNNNSGNRGLNDMHSTVVTLVAGRDLGGRLPHLCQPHNLICKPQKYTGTR